MNSYQSMGVPPSASSFAQFYHQAAAASAVSAASAGVVGVGVDSLGNCTQSSTGVVSTAGSAGSGLPDLPRYPWMALTGGNNFLCFFCLELFDFHGFAISDFYQM